MHAQYDVISQLFLKWKINKATWSYFDRCLEVKLYHKLVLLSTNVCSCIELSKQSLSTHCIVHVHAFIFHCHAEL